MKNSPEHILKKMYTSVKRNKFDRTTSFCKTTTLSMTHVVPLHVVPLTGNETYSVDLEQYLLTDSTPTAVFETLRVDVRAFFVPQRLYTLGLYGDNLEESSTIENLRLPRASLINYYTWGDMSTAQGPLVMRGSLLHRLGVPAQITTSNGARPLNKKHLILGDVDSIALSGTPSANNSGSMVNYAVVAGYYDICRNYLANKFEDKVPIAQSKTFKFSKSSGSSEFDTLEVTDGGVAWQSLSQYGRYINHLRGVANASDYSEDGYFNPPSPLSVMYGGGSMPDGSLSFVGLITDSYVYDGQQISSLESPTEKLAPVVELLQNRFTNTGLWPTRYDSHYQTMFFQPDEIEDLMVNTEIGDNVQSFRLAESRFATTLKSLLRGRTTTAWIDANFGVKLKMKDKPIFVGGDSFVVNFQQIVNVAGTEGGLKLGDTGGRGVGGSKKAFDADGKNKKRITFTTQEPGYLMFLVSATPNVAYGDVIENFHEYDTLVDFPLPAWSGKTFQDLRLANLAFTGTIADDYVVGKQPYGFDYMTNYDRVDGMYNSEMKETFVFKRDFDLYGLLTSSSSSQQNILNYVRSCYVEPETFGDNFNVQEADAYQNFTLKTAFNVSVVLPLEDQVTDYNI